MKKNCAIIALALLSQTAQASFMDDVYETVSNVGSSAKQFCNDHKTEILVGTALVATAGIATAAYFDVYGLRTAATTWLNSNFYPTPEGNPEENKKQKIEEEKSTSTPEQKQTPTPKQESKQQGGNNQPLTAQQWFDGKKASFDTLVRRYNDCPPDSVDQKTGDYIVNSCHNAAIKGFEDEFSKIKSSIIAKTNDAATLERRVDVYNLVVKHFSESPFCKILKEVDHSYVQNTLQSHFDIMNIDETIRGVLSKKIKEINLDIQCKK